MLFGFGIVAHWDVTKNLRKYLPMYACKLLTVVWLLLGPLRSIAIIYIPSMQSECMTQLSL